MKNDSFYKKKIIKWTFDSKLMHQVGRDSKK